MLPFAVIFEALVLPIDTVPEWPFKVNVGTVIPGKLTPVFPSRVRLLFALV